MYHYPTWKNATNIIILSHLQHGNEVKNGLGAFKRKLLFKRLHSCEKKVSFTPAQPCLNAG